MSREGERCGQAGAATARVGRLRVPPWRHPARFARVGCEAAATLELRWLWRSRYNWPPILCSPISPNSHLNAVVTTEQKEDAANHAPIGEKHRGLKMRGAVTLAVQRARRCQKWRQRRRPAGPAPLPLPLPPGYSSSESSPSTVYTCCLVTTTMSSPTPRRKLSCMNTAGGGGGGAGGRIWRLRAGWLG